MSILEGGREDAWLAVGFLAVRLMPHHLRMTDGLGVIAVALPTQTALMH